MSLVLNYVLGLLARREYSEFELRCKMQSKGFSEEEIDDTLAHCQRKNWQNDQRFAENYIYYRTQRGYGLNRIKQELSQLKGVRKEDIEAALQQREIDWEDTALTVLRKKFPDYQNITDFKQKQKVWRYMLSHGFSPDDFSQYVGCGDEGFDEGNDENWE